MTQDEKLCIMPLHSDKGDSKQRLEPPPNINAELKKFYV